MIEAALIVGIAGWRVASLLVHEDGPGRIFERIRRAAGVPAAGRVEGFLPEMLTCVWCTALWTAAAMAVLWWISPWIPTIIAAAGVAVMVEQWCRR